MRRSRLSKNFEKKSQKTIILSIVGIIIVIFLLLKFGLGLLVSFSLFLSGSKGGQNQSDTNNQINFVPPPTLNPLPIATNSAQIVISGAAGKNTTIELWINNRKTDQIETADDGGYTFSQTLKEGDNQIKTRASVKDRKSDFSNSFDVTYKKSQPKLDVSTPSDGQSFNKNTVGTNNSITVAGATDPNVTVTVNGFWAVVDDNNNFSYTLPLQGGDNQIKIIALDQAGNKSEKDLKVNFSQ